MTLNIVDRELKKTLETEQKKYTPDFVSRYTRKCAEAKEKSVQLLEKLLEESRNTGNFQDTLAQYQYNQDSSEFTLNRFMGSRKSKIRNTPTSSNPGCQF